MFRLAMHELQTLYFERSFQAPREFRKQIEDTVAEIRQGNTGRSVLSAGGCAFTPRGTAHTFQIFGTARARMLVMVAFGGVNQFFEALSA